MLSNEDELMIRNLIYAAVCLFLFSGIENVKAQDATDMSDHPLITRYAGSVIDGYEVQEFNEFILPTGPAIKDDKGNRVPSEKLSLEGQITRILYRGPEGRSTLEIFRNYQAALKSAGFEVLFSCSDKECGRLFHWLLYKDKKKIKTTKTSGAAFDQPQDIRYLSARKTAEDGTIIHVSLLVAIDSIWTKNPVTLLEIIESKSMDIGMVSVNAEVMAEDIDATGHISIYGISFDTNSDSLKVQSDSTLEEIGKLLSECPSLKLLVVGHTDNQGGYDYNINLSQRRAAAVVKALTQRFGIDAMRLKPAGVGYLSPVATNDTADGQAQNRRVELVKN